MDQDTANERIKEYGFVLLLNAPEQMQFGINNQYWRTGQMFKGVKLIPPGAHYIYYSLKDEEYAARMGFFIYIAKKQDVVVRRWDEEKQEFIRLPESEEVSYAEGVRNMDFDKNLGAYPMENHSQWLGLSNLITKEVLETLEPNQQTILSEERERELRKQEEASTEKQEKPTEEKEKKSQLDIDQTIEKLEKEVEQEEKRLNKAQNREYKYSEAYNGFNYTSIPVRKVVHGLSGSALTEMNFDKSSILIELIKNEYKQEESALLGELQFCFVTFLLGENLESFEQWKKLVCLMFNCESALVSHKDLFVRFIPVIYEQLKQLPKDFFFADLSKVSFLNDSLKSFFEITSDPKVSKKLRQRIEKLKQMLMKEYGFLVPLSLEERLMQQLNLEDEDMPAIVDEQEKFIRF